MKKFIDVFVERSDGKIWPIPGVYSAVNTLENLGQSIKLHDTFLTLPEKTILNYLFQYKESDNKVLIIYIGGFVYEKLDPNTKEWLSLINKRIALIKSKINNLYIYAVGFFSTDIPVNNILRDADQILKDGYDSLLNIFYKNIIPSYGERKSVKYQTANGFKWHSENIMIDMPDMRCPIGFCINCTNDPKYCDPMKLAKSNKIENSFLALKNDLSNREFPKNLALTGNPLTLSENKLVLINQTLSEFKNNTFELHLEFNFPELFIHNEIWNLLKNFNIGSLRLVIPASTLYGLEILGYKNFDIYKILEKIRKIIGYTPYIMVNLHIGLPGDNIESIENTISRLDKFVDQISVQVITLHKDSKLIKHHDFNIINNEIDIWGNCDWKLPEISRQEALLWSEDFHQKSMNSPAYLNYRSFDDVLYANNKGLSSQLIRQDLNDAKNHNNSSSWLFNKILMRRIALNSEYIELYDRSPLV